MESHKDGLRKLGVQTAIALALLGSLLVAGCQGIMVDQPRYDPLEASTLFPDGQSARPVVANSYPWQDDGYDPMLASGKSEDGQILTGFPFQVTLEVLERGRDRYDIYCSPCHGLTGNGTGQIAQQGFEGVPSFNTDEMRQHPPGHFVDAIANGSGRMLSYGYRIGPADRWAIAAYIKALQLSQHATLDDVPPEEKAPLQTGTP